MTEDRLVFPCMEYDVVIEDKAFKEICKLKLDLGKCATCNFYKPDKTPVAESPVPPM